MTIERTTSVLARNIGHFSRARSKTAVGRCIFHSYFIAVPACYKFRLSCPIAATCVGWERLRERVLYSVFFTMGAYFVPMHGNLTLPLPSSLASAWSRPKFTPHNHPKVLAFQSRPKYEAIAAASARRPPDVGLPTLVVPASVVLR
jgi:hypothetical protein